MNTEDAVAILEMLMEGVDPISGEIFPEEHACHEPAVIRALYKAISALRSTERQEKDEQKGIRPEKKKSRTRPWSLEETMQLKALYEKGTPMDEICQRLDRREKATIKQLQYLGLIRGVETLHGNDTFSQGETVRSHAPWSYQEDQKLWEMKKQGLSMKKIAAALARSDYAVFCRLERWGLTDEDRLEPYHVMFPGWQHTDTLQVRQWHNEGVPVEEIAQRMERPIGCIVARMREMGLK